MFATVALSSDICHLPQNPVLDGPTRPAVTVQLSSRLDEKARKSTASGEVERKLPPVMIVRNPADLRANLGRDQRLMGLDVGKKTIGLALTDVTLTIASPYDTIRRKRFRDDAEALATIIEREDVGGLVLGLPFNMDGSEGPRCQSVRQFATNLEERLALPYAFWDERLSTAAVTRTLLDADASRRRRARVVDKMAAAYILQGALDAMAA